jgi:hypothetical protein
MYQEEAGIGRVGGKKRRMYYLTQNNFWSTSPVQMVEVTTESLQICLDL